MVGGRGLPRVAHLELTAFPDELLGRSLSKVGQLELATHIGAQVLGGFWGAMRAKRQGGGAKEGLLLKSASFSLVYSLMSKFWGAVGSWGQCGELLLKQASLSLPCSLIKQAFGGHRGWGGGGSHQSQPA